MGYLRGPSVTVTPSKCNNIYIRVQPERREGHAAPRVSEMLRECPPHSLYRVSPSND